MAETGLVAQLCKRAQDCLDMGLTPGTKVVGRSCYLDAAEIAAPYEERLSAAEARVKELNEALLASWSISWMAKECADGGGINSPEMRDYERVEQQVEMALEVQKL